jgi:hypothetical protein
MMLKLQNVKHADKLRNLHDNDDLYNMYMVLNYSCYYC